MLRALVVMSLLVPLTADAEPARDEPTLRMEHGLREKLADVGEALGLRTADVSVLRTQPVPESRTSWATSGFGWREDPIRRRAKFHTGADVRAKPGTPVLAAGDGIVTFAGRRGGYGNVIYVDHGGGVITRYAHLRRIETVEGATVTAGARIGQVGSTGRTTGPHLHFEVRIGETRIDPLVALPK